MSIDMFPDAAVDYIINHTGGTMTDQQSDERINVDEVPVVVAVEYHNDPMTEDVVLAPGLDPFVLFEMKQQDGMIVLDVTASVIEGEDELIETLEVFFETMLEERMSRQAAAAMAELGVLVGDVVDEAVDQYLDEEAVRASEDATIRDLGGH